MAFNSTDVLQYIEMNLGASIQILELTPEEIMETVTKVTLPTFSLYYPHFHMIRVKPKEDAVPGRFNCFYLKTDFEIIGVTKVLSENYLGNQGLPMAYYDSDPINRQMTADIASMFFQPLTFDYESPNILSVYPKTLLTGQLEVQLKVVHPSHLGTIPFSLREEFLECALVDVRRALYPIRQRFQQINTTFGNIELFMDKLESANDDRKEILQRWRENFMKTSRRKKFYFG